MVLFKVLEKSIGIISTMILARLLVPEDFGLIAMAMSVVAGLELLQAFSFDVALIQKQDAGPDHYNTAWSFKVSFGILSAALLILIAPYASIFYEEPRLTHIFYALSLVMVVQSLSNIGVVDFRKKMRFDKEFKWMLSRKLAGFMVTIYLAFTIKSYWALISGVLAGEIVSTILSYMMHPYRPRFSFKAAGDLIKFSSWLLINNILFFMKLRSSDFVIGRYSGSYYLGIFSISYEISNLPTTELVAPINRAVFPGYANLSNKLEDLQKGFINVLSIIYLFSLPIAVGIALTAVLFVPVFFGLKWVEMIPLIQILSYFGLLTAIQTNSGSVLLAVGKPKILTGLAFVYVALLIPCLVYSVQKYGVMGAAWTYLAVSIFIIPFTYGVVLKVLKLRWNNIFHLSWRPVVSVLLMHLGVSNYISLFDYKLGLTHSLVGLFSSVTIGGLIYCVSVLLLWILVKKPDGAEQLLLEKLASMKLSIISRFAEKALLSRSRH